MKRIASAAAFAAVFTAVASSPAPLIAGDLWAGKYAGHLGSYRWEATIKNKAAGGYSLHASVVSRLPLCSGDVEASAKLAGGKLIVDDNDCALTISKIGGNQIQIVENQCNNWHGAACIFSSKLTRN